MEPETRGQNRSGLARPRQRCLEAEEGDESNARAADRESPFWRSRLRSCTHCTVTEGAYPHPHLDTPGQLDLNRQNRGDKGERDQSVLFPTLPVFALSITLAQTGRPTKNSLPSQAVSIQAAGLPVGWGPIMVQCSKVCRESRV